MAVAALVISIVSLFVAGLAVWFAWRQAKAAEASTAIERRRYHAEREPVFEGGIESLNGGCSNRLDLRLVKGGPLAEVTATIVEGDGVEFAGNQHGAPGPEPRVSAFTVEALKTGEVASWHVVLSESYSARIRLACVCRSGDGDEWEASTWVDLPAKPLVAWG